MRTDRDLIEALAALGNVRGSTLVGAADAPDVLWNRLSTTFGFDRVEADRLRALILRAETEEGGQ